MSGEADKIQVPPILLFGKGQNHFPNIDNIYGGKEFKTRLEDIVLAMENPMLFGCMGIDVPKSFLFTGPPGTGKTYTTQAIVGSLADKLESDKRVAFVKYDIGSVGTAYINMGARNMATVFQIGDELIKEENIEHVVYFFDECDAIMSKRGGSQSKEDDKTLEAMMKGLQDVNDRGQNEYIFMATNFPEALDDASIRSGRVNYKLDFPLPDAEHRRQLLAGYLESHNERVGYQVFRQYNVDELVDLTNGFNCADIQFGIQNSVAERVRLGLRTKPKGIIPAWYITQKGLKESFENIKVKKEPEKSKIGFMRD
jgi:ATP-dependent 26S proteasome regulatory subunit